MTPSENLFANTIDANRGAGEKVFTGDRKSGHPHVIFGQLVGLQKFEALTGFADIGAPAFVEAEGS